ncbi:MAG: hypothetical protein AB9917_03815 [Negativicutes bacterium]
MKIDDFIRTQVIRTNTSSIGSKELEAGAATDVSSVFTNAASEMDISLPDLLQGFGQLVARRQELSASLPASIRNRLAEVTRSPQGDESSVVIPEHATIQQGVSTLVRESRALADATRLLASELEFTERVPEFADIVTLAKEEITSSMLPNTSRSSGQLKMANPGVLQELVNKGLNTLQNNMGSDRNIPTPAAILANLLNKSIHTGTMSKELSGWVKAVGAALKSVADDLSVQTQLDYLISRADPQVVQVAQVTGRPELIRMWAAVQLWGMDSASTLSSVFGAIEEAAPLTQVSISAMDGRAAIQAAVQGIATEILEFQPQQLAALPSAAVSQAGRFEWLITSLAARPENLNNLIAILPEVMSKIKSALPDRKDDKTVGVAYQKLARSAPKWLQTMSERENAPELLELWVAAKTTDLIPWAKLSLDERQQSMETLKELASTYDQPALFRSSGEDSTSRSLMFQVALYAPGQEKPYPALIQVYEEKKDRGNAELPEQEVWVRVSLETNHIGTVDFSFRLQDKKYLTIFSRFADSTVASDFQAFLPEIRQELATTSLELKKFAIAQQNGAGVIEDG